jgi:hypothetical protein
MSGIDTVLFQTTQELLVNQRAALFAVLAIAAAGCNSGSTVTVTQLAPGSAQCPNGGVEIKVGGGQPQDVCNGTNGSNGGLGTLVVTAPLLPGDTNCPAGGVLISSGLDNGAGGGTAGDGILQTGEVLSSEVICNGDTGARPGLLTPPSGPAGAFTINANGGGGGVDGGAGGEIQINESVGGYGGAVKIFRTGLADATFAFPLTVPAPTQGSNPYNIPSSITISPQASAAPSLTALTPFTYGGNLYLATGTATAAQPVTSLTIAASATVTFAMTSAAVPANSAISLNFVDGVANKGTILAGASSTANVTGSLTINCSDYFGDVGSKITTTGVAGDATHAGGTAGSISLQTGSFWNKGDFDSSGGTGQTAGSGNSINILSSGPIFNNGNLTSRGGSSLSNANVGGGGGFIQLISYSDLNNQGDLTTSGGTGSTGGNASYIQMNAGSQPAAAPVPLIATGPSAGSLRNKGKLTARGGDSVAGCSTTCGGGGGNFITLGANQGQLISSGNLTAAGGTGVTGNGGPGAPITIQVAGGNVAAGDLTLSGNLDSSGGSGAIAGNYAGAISLTLSNGQSPAGQEIILLGYTSINSNGGGTATGAGGPGGSMTFSNSLGQFANGNNNVPGGAVVVYSDLNCVGGTATGGLGGPAGQVYLTAGSNYFPGAKYEQVLNAGSINVHGGDGATGGGSAGGVSMDGQDGVKNLGTITSTGGNATGATSIGSGYAAVSMNSANGPVDNRNTIDVSGGASKGATTGGPAGTISLIGLSTAESGTLKAIGGAADATTGTGGNGGRVSIAAYSGLSTVTAVIPGGIQVNAGTGHNPGTGGTVTVDGRNVTDSYTH